MDRTWQRIHGMTATELEAYAKDHRVDLSARFDSMEQAADHVCEQLGVEKPADEEGDAGVRIDQLAREYQRNHANCSYSVALAETRKAHPSLAQQYARSFGVKRY